MSAQIKNVTEKVYQMGSTHRMGKHSLSDGEIVLFVAAAAMVLAPNLWAKMPVVGKWGSATIALVLLFIALVVW